MKFPDAATEQGGCMYIRTRGQGGAPKGWEVRGCTSAAGDHLSHPEVAMYSLATNSHAGLVGGLVQ